MPEELLQAEEEHGCALPQRGDSLRRIIEPWTIQHPRFTHFAPAARGSVSLLLPAI